MYSVYYLGSRIRFLREILKEPGGEVHSLREVVASCFIKVGNFKRSG